MITDEKGKWLENNNVRILIEPSQQYLDEREQQILLDSLIPTPEELAKAQREIEILELLQEAGII